MEGEMMSQSVGLAQYFGAYGSWGVLAILAMVIVHLYRQQSALSKEVRETVAKYAEETARLQEQTLAELQRSREVIERNTEALSRLTMKS